jgi:hypothetical protein
VRGNRSDLLSRVEVHSGARRAGYLRAGPLSLFSMHPRPANLLSTSGFWHTLFCPQLLNAAMMPVIGLRRWEAPLQLPARTADDTPFLGHPSEGVSFHVFETSRPSKRRHSD